MLLIGNQLKAARALAGIEQQELADAAKVHVNTIRKMEAKSREEITSAADVLRRVQTALEDAGVEFTNGGQPGVRMKAKPPSANDGVPKGWTLDPAEADRYPPEPAAARAPKRSAGSELAPRKSPRQKRR